ncbi:membrane protein insertase YidC [Mycoavidus sp. B2-EB]|uniref:membrane protein insertase YidC n=1 Tax=Mycoavidus sp. B2-EB TaxID=2651972 RepID=UPI001627E94A|nr:membrane protein insertase YidC [Mycoavidus sp. B2-EB]BBO60531.1 membrane protein insertase YidC [Mycoavidus sp. B2-EB]
MDIKRNILWVILVISLVMLFDNWQRYNGRPASFFPDPAPAQTVSQSTLNPSLTASPLLGAAAAPDTQVAANSEKIHIKTDVYEAEINTQGGTLSKLSLTRHADGQQENQYVTLFDETPSHVYLARTGLIGGGFPNHNDIFRATPGPRELTSGANTLEVCLESPVKNGVKFVKRYTFTRGSYVIGVQHEIVNASSVPVQPVLYMELVRDSAPVETPRFSYTYIGPVVYTSQQNFQKIGFSDIDKNKANYARQADNGWVAMVQHHFASAWLLQQGVTRDIYVQKVDSSLYRVGTKQTVQTLMPGQTVQVPARLFAGPEEERMLENIAPGLELVKDYGWVTIIAKPLFWLLEKIHNLLGNWGWSIVALTLLIKAVFFPLSAASYRSMARMKEISPRMQALRERFKSEPQKMNAALMELYKTEKINPLGGCLPVVIQIPVFISLYWVLLSSVEMRGAPWIGWIHDLSQQDPYFILPILMALSMFVQTRLNPTPPDPLQAKMMMFMPLAFSVMFFFFPAGLVLYYVVNNVLSILQQWYITKRVAR